MHSAKYNPIVVVGGCNFDIYATSHKPLLAADSNPGMVYTTPGGVGRNIAENLARLDSPTCMLTALGNDAFGDAIVKQAETIHLDLSKALRLPHASTSVYVCINQNDGDIAVAVSDMDICEEINPAYLQSCEDVLQAAEIVVADANLSKETLTYLSAHYGQKLCVDCVSGPKAEKLLPLLQDVYCIKANRAEAEIISGVHVNTDKDAAVAAEKLHAKGIHWVIITLGESGAYVSNPNHSCAMPLMPGETSNTSGCGDAFFAGAIAALVNQKPVHDITRWGLAMARLCAASPFAVSSQVTRQALQDTLQTYQGGAWK